MKEHNDIEELPTEFVAALKKRELPADVITRRVDCELAAMATAQFSARRSASRRYVWAAAAAAVVIGIVVAFSALDPALTRNDLYTDVDGSGQIDIADVLALARDGRDLTPSDLDAFAASIVSLDGDES